MSHKTKLFFVLFLTVVFSATMFAGNKKSGDQVQDYTSIARVTSTAEGTNLNFLNPILDPPSYRTGWAGTFNGTLNSDAVKFYCIDLGHGLAQNSDYWDEGSTPSEITYILNNYYPQATHPNQLSNISKEAAAVQIAVWHFSDGVDANTIQNDNTVRVRALSIIADAEANHENVKPVNTLVFDPAIQFLAPGTTASFKVKALDLDGNPVAGVDITLAANLGTLSTTSVSTNAMGESSEITLSYNGTGNAVISASANVEIPQGTRYVHKANPHDKQKLVLATPSTDIKEVYGNVTWISGGGDCDLTGMATFTQGGWGSKGNSVPGQIRDTYFDTVFPNDLVVGGNHTITLTSAYRVEKFLPSGGTPDALDRSYTDPYRKTSGGVLAAQVVALSLNVYYDEAGVLGTNSNMLKDLVFVSGPFQGKTVKELLDIANSALGGGPTYGYSYSEINDAATAVNENFDNGTTDNGVLTCQTEVIPKASLGDYVWLDENKNGIQDAGEQGVEDVTVYLYDCNGTQLSSTTTDANGKYLFADLLPGDYSVKFDLPTGYVFTTQDAGSNDAVDSDVNPLTGKTICTNLIADENDLTWDAGIHVDGPECATDWSATFGPDSSICEFEPDWITVNGAVSLTPNPSRAKLQTSWRIVWPKGEDIDNTVHYSNTWISKDTTFSIKGWWPGVSAKDTMVVLEFVVNVLDCEGNSIHAPIAREIYWNPTICPPPVEEPDVKIEKSVNDTEVNNGDKVTYTIKVTNDGPGKAEGVEVVDVLPEGTTFVSANASQGTYNSTSGLWTVGTLTNGAIATLAIEAEVDLGTTSAVDFGPATGYNLFLFGNLEQPSSDTQGKMAVGGDAKLGAYSVGDQLENSNGAVDVMIIGGDLTYTSGGIFGGNVVVGGTTNLPIDPVSITGGELKFGTPIDFNAAEASLKALSSDLAAYPANGTTELKWGGLKLRGTHPQLNVFEVDGAVLSDAHSMAISVPNGSVVLVNISGEEVTWTGGLTVNGTKINNVLYNFPEAKKLNISGIDIRGSILAPYAHLNYPTGVINGQVIAKSMKGAGQFNLALFSGHIPVGGQITNCAEITKTYPTDPDLTNNSACVAINVDVETSAGGDEQTSEWKQVTTFSLDEIVWALTFDNQGRLLAGTVGGNIYRSADNGANWELLNSDMNVGFIWSIVIGENDRIFASTEQGVFYMNAIGDWKHPNGMANDTRALAYDADNSILYAGTWGFGIYKSIDNGVTWSDINNGLTSKVVNSIAVDANGNVYAATFGGGVFSSDDMGATWNKTNLPFEHVWAVDVTSNGDVYAATYGGGVFGSDDMGNTWQDLNNGLNDALFVYSVAVDGEDNVYVSTWTGGIFKLEAISAKAMSGSSAKSVAWSPAGMGGLGISSLAADKTAGMIYAGGENGALFVKNTDGTTSVEEEIPTEFGLSQNYPNPFNPSTNIEVKIKLAGKYQLKIYNILGQEVATLMNKAMQPGTYTFKFNAIGLATGVYIYKFSGKNVNFTKKMLLVK